MASRSPSAASPASATSAAAPAVAAAPAAAASPRAQTSASNKKGRKLVIALSVTAGIVLAILVAIGIIYGVYGPQKPSFTLDDVVAYRDSTSSASGLLVTVTAINPSRTDLNYGKLSVYLSAKDKTTEAAEAEGTVQGPREKETWSVLLTEISGAGQGEMGLVRVDVPIQWKIGFFYTPMVKIHVKCPLILNTMVSDKPVHIDSRCSAP